MPVYEYECENPGCKHTFEEMQSIRAPKLKTCPKCGKDTLVRLIGKSGGFVFKGEGFYETDVKQKEEKDAIRKLDSE